MGSKAKTPWFLSRFHFYVKSLKMNSHFMSTVHSRERGHILIEYPLDSIYTPMPVRLFVTDKRRNQSGPNYKSEKQ